MNLGHTFLKLALPGSCPSPQNRGHGPIVQKLMLFAKCDCRVGMVCDNGRLAAKLMHSEAYRSRHCLAERMLRCICITAGLSADPRRLIGVANQPKYHAVVYPYMNSRVLCRQVQI